MKLGKVKSLKFNIWFVVLQMMKNDQVTYAIFLKMASQTPVVPAESSMHQASLEKPQEGEATGCTMCKHCGCMLNKP